MHRDKKSASPVTSPLGGAGAGRLAGGTLLERARKALRQKSADIIETSVSLNQVAGLADGGGEAEAAAQEGKRDEVQTGEGSVSVSEEERRARTSRRATRRARGRTVQLPAMRSRRVGAGTTARQPRWEQVQGLIRRMS